MHRRQRRRRIKNNPRSHPYAAIAALWSLRILVDLDGWTGLSIHELTSDGGLLRTIGLESLDDEEPNRRLLLQKLKERQAQVEAGKPALGGVLGEDLERVLDGTLKAMCCSGNRIRTSPAAMTYRLDALNPDCDLDKLLAGIKRHPRARLCLYGPPRTGKTEFGASISRELDKPLSVKRASDLLDPFLGMTEKHIARMFEEARDDDAVLLLEEVDSFLQERSGAYRSWEITQVNELLTPMEHFDGLFICSTNLVDSLDAAALRRFDFKIQFDFLEVEQAWRLFRQVRGYPCQTNAPGKTGWAGSRT